MLSDTLEGGGGVGAARALEDLAVPGDVGQAAAGLGSQHPPFWWVMLWLLLRL